MRSIRIAEELLALVTSRERAASTVGDLAETAVIRGAVWFWFSVFHTAASLVLREITGHPVRVTGLALAGAAIDFAIGLLFAGVSGVVFFFLANVLRFPGWDIWVPAGTLITSVFIGRFLARLAPGREMAVCLVYVVLAPFFSLIVDFPMGFGLSGAAWMLFAEALLRTSSLVGAAWGRSASTGVTFP